MNYTSRRRNYVKNRRKKNKTRKPKNPRILRKPTAKSVNRTKNKTTKKNPTKKRVLQLVPKPRTTRKNQNFYSMNETVNKGKLGTNQQLKLNIKYLVNRKYKRQDPHMKRTNRIINNLFNLVIYKLYKKRQHNNKKLPKNRRIYTGGNNDDSSNSTDEPNDDPINKKIAEFNNSKQKIFDTIKNQFKINLTPITNLLDNEQLKDIYTLIDIISKIPIDNDEVESDDLKSFNTMIQNKYKPTENIKNIYNQILNSYEKDIPDNIKEIVEIKQNVFTNLLNPLLIILLKDVDLSEFSKIDDLSEIFNGVGDEKEGDRADVPAGENEKEGDGANNAGGEE